MTVNKLDGVSQPSISYSVLCTSKGLMI